ncbi:MAG: hypothetical protein ACU84H_04950 [Gammaproteobacteria bacterium]
MKYPVLSVMQIKNLDYSFRLLILILISGIAFSGVFAARGLYADGSFFLFNVLKTEDFWDFDKSRAFAQIISQIPVVFAMKIGVTDLNALIRLHSFGLIAIPLGFWFAALLIQINTYLFWLFVFSFSVSYLSSGFFAIGEYNLAYAMAALSASIILRNGRLGKICSLTLILISILLTRVYEAMLVLGPLLFAISMFRLLLTPKRDVFSSKIALIISSFFFATSSLTSVWSIMFDPVHTYGSESSSAISILSIMFHRDTVGLSTALDVKSIMKSKQLIYMILMCVLCLILAMTERNFLKTIAIIDAFLISSIYLFNTSFWHSPVNHYEFRSVSGLMLFFVIAFAAAHYFFLKKLDYFEFLELKRSKYELISLLCFISLTIPFYVQTFGFYRWARIYEQEVTTRTGLISIESTRINHSYPYEGYNWTWTNPSLSLLFRGNLTGAIILNKKDQFGWQPFKPDEIDDNVLGAFKKNSPLYPSL